MADHSTNGAAPLPAASGSRRAVFVISLICAAQFVLQLDFSIVNVALPSIQRELGMPAAELQWIVVTQPQDLDVLGGIGSSEQCQPAQQAGEHQVEGSQGHSG